MQLLQSIRRQKPEDLRPTVEIANGVAEVTCCTYSPFGGLYRRIYHVDMVTGEVDRLLKKENALENIIAEYAFDPSQNHN